MTTLQSELVKSLIKSGPWAMLAGALLVMFLYEVRPALASIRAEHAEMRAEMNGSLRELVRHARQSAYLEFRNCVNTAGTSELRERCVPPEEPTR